MLPREGRWTSAPTLGLWCNTPMNPLEVIEDFQSKKKDGATPAARPTKSTTEVPVITVSDESTEEVKSKRTETLDEKDYEVALNQN